MTSGRWWGLALGLLTSACSEGADSLRVFLGTWNYDQPDRATGQNVAEIVCPPLGGRPAFTRQIPQIGSLTLSRIDDRTLRGQTDQGCSWTFGVSDQTTLELSPAQQTCENPVIRSSYTLTRWSFLVHGRQARELVEAKSHQPAGDCDFLLAQGQRSAAAEGSDGTVAFEGSWADDPPDAMTGSNIAQLVCAGGVQPWPQTGQLQITRTGPTALTGLTERGCRFTFRVSGNTAQLEPATQTCSHPTEGDGITVTHWSMASDGQQLAEVVSGQTHPPAGDCDFVVGIGSRSRR